MSADATEEEAAVDVRVPTRRRRASDDELDDAEFHDAAEYAASVAGSHAVGEDNGIADEDIGEELVERDDDSAGNENTPGDAVEAEIPAEETDHIEERKKAKLREPFDVPTSGAFWLHDDRFGEEEQAEHARAGNARKAKSDTEGRWLHDKFSMLDVEDEAEDEGSESAFSHFRNRGRGGRGVRGGRRGGVGRGSPPSARSRGSGGLLVRVRRGEGLDNNGSESADTGAPVSLDEMQGALPQREQRQPRAAPRSTFGSAAADEIEPASNDTTQSYMADYGAARGRGRGSGRGGRDGGRGGLVSSGRGRGERSFSPDGGPRGFGTEPERGPGYGRGRGRGGWDEGPREGGGREGYGSGGRGRRGDGGRGGYDHDDRDAGPGVRDVGASSNGGPYDGGRGRGRGRGRPPMGDSYTFGRSSGPSRGAGPGRGSPGPLQHPSQDSRRHDRTVDEDFPPLPGSAARPQAAAPAAPQDVDPAAWAAADTGAASGAGGGVRRYSKMAGKVSGDVTGSSGAPLGEGVQRARGDSNRASKLSAAAPTFEPSPVAAGTGQAGKQPGPPPPQQQQQSQAAMSQVPAAFGAPLQPMTTVASMPLPAAPSPAAGGGVPEAYGAATLQPPRPAQPYMPQQPPPPPPPQQLQSQQPYNPPMQVMPAHQPQGMVVGQMGPPQQQQPMQQHPHPYAAASAYYGGYADMETWFQDAYQKALATGMDPQQAYSTVQGYVQGIQMAFQQLRGAYPSMGPQMHAPPAGP